MESSLWSDLHTMSELVFLFEVENPPKFVIYCPTSILNIEKMVPVAHAQFKAGVGEINISVRVHFSFCYLVSLRQGHHTK